jgi:o-succinylbenzoate---CoA ligase
MDWLREAAQRRADAPAVVTSWRTVSYAELDRAADGAAAIVLGSGVEGPVAVWGDRTPEAVALLWGALRSGRDCVVVDPGWPPARQQRLTEAAGARALLTPPEGGLDRLVRRGDAAPPAAGPPAASSRLVVFTSGSEGPRTGVVLTGANVAGSVDGVRRRLGNTADTPWLCVLPPSHVGGLAVLFRQVERGAAVVLEARFDPARVARRLGDVIYASLVPTMLRRLLDEGVPGGATVLVGGAPASEALLRRAVAAGLRPLQTYGMTETASAVTLAAPDRLDDELGTAGRALDGAEVRVVADGEPVVGMEGRIEVRGSMVSTATIDGLERDPETWFVTGDLGVLDAEGRLTVVGRADAVIVSGGINVHPAAVQAVLEQHPAVSAARVFGEADDDWGERVVAEVVAAGIDVGLIRDWAARHLHPAEVPKVIRAVESLAVKLE